MFVNIAEKGVYSKLSFVFRFSHEIDMCHEMKIICRDMTGRLMRNMYKMGLLNLRLIYNRAMYLFHSPFFETN
jgi:hypothetical protein